MDVLRFYVWLMKWIFGGLLKGIKGLWELWRDRKPSTTFGSARWASRFQILRGGAWGSKGLIVGKKAGRFLRFNGDGALLVTAPMGSGKGVGIVIPNLLDYPGAVICTDPKGENAAITARHRKTLGPVYCLNAINPDISDCFNPMDMVRVGTSTEFDDALALADLLVTPEGSDAHWDTSAKQVLAAVIMYVQRTRPPELRILASVGRLMNDGENALEETFKAMAQRPEPSISEQGTTALRSLAFPEFNSVMSNTSKALKIWAADRIAGRLSMTSDFDLMDVHRTTMTLYVMVPEDMLAVYAPFLRVVMGCAMAALVRGKSLPRPNHKPLLLIDEAAALGRLDALERGVGYLREYARLVLVFQDYGQIRARYGDNGADSFKAASGAQVVFGVNDLRSAQEMADILGPTTVRTRSEGQSQASTDVLKRQEQAGTSEAGRLLLDASEIMRLEPTRAIVRLNTVRAPILASKVRYFKVGKWRGLWDAWRGDAPAPFPADAPGHGARSADQADAPGFPEAPPAPHQSGLSGPQPADAAS